MGVAQDSFNLQIPLVQRPMIDSSQEILRAVQQKKYTTVNISIPVSNPIVPIIQNPQPLPISNTLTADEKQFLEFLYQSTELLPLNEIRQQLGAGAKKIYKQINSLLDKGLIAENQLSLSAAGRKSRVVLITSDGVKALGHPAPQGKGGALHQYMQRIVKSYAEKKGYQVVIEQSLTQQKSVDLHLEKDGQKTAVEISITTDANQELANIQKCLTAGYDRIIVCCIDNQTKQSLEYLINRSLNAEMRGKMFIPPITGLFQLI